MGAWTVCRFKGDLAKKRWCFWGEVDTTMNTMYETRDKITSYFSLFLLEWGNIGARLFSCIYKFSCEGSMINYLLFHLSIYLLFQINLEW